MIVIKKLPKNSWKAYRDLRLEALMKEPQAFGSSFEEEVKLVKSEWEKRINNALFAILDGELVGMIVYVYEKKNKTSHIADIFGFYVKKKYRGIGFGKKLFEKVLSEIKQNEKIIKIKLSVNPLQKSALKIYESYGFGRVGLMKKELRLNGKLFDELLMEKIF